MTEERSMSVTIGDAAAASGVSAKMIRYYESIGLIPQARRSAAGYRFYSDRDVQTLRFIRRARDLGFLVEDIGQLLELWRNDSRSSAEVKRLALDHLAALQAKIKTLEAMCRTLEHLAGHCHGDNRPECPILDNLSDITGDFTTTTPSAGSPPRIHAPGGVLSADVTRRRPPRP